MSDLLTRRWHPMKPHEVQIAYRSSPHRFNVVPAGRRSGKTERAKRKLVTRAMKAGPGARFFAAAPTHQQAKRIYWPDLKAMVPSWLLAEKSESEKVLTLVNGAQIHVFGMDKPERMEGSPWDGGVLDEYANMKPEAWTEHVRPALSDRLGWCDMIGVPEGRNHYYELYRQATAEQSELGPDSGWGGFTWPSADILPASEIEAARRDLDELTFRQEYEASFVNFVGQAYYPFNEAEHCERLEYNPRAPLIIALDFNVSPGVAALGQEMKLPNGVAGTGWIGEVWIPRNSNTPRVCRKLVQDWGEHEGPVICYGDATGGARGTAQVRGSDWDLVKDELRPTFGERLSLKVPSSNPKERARLNAMNSRLKSQDGTVRMMVDPSRAPHLVRDFEGVRLVEGGAGEIDKKSDPNLTHLTDAVGYYVHREFPVSKPAKMNVQRLGVL